MENLKATEQANLKNAVAAFTFSRLPREQRIAQILFEIMKPMLQYDIHDEEATFFPIKDWTDLKEVSEELAKYAIRDFALRPGHIADATT